MKRILALVVVLMLLAAHCYAMPVRTGEETLTATATNVSDGTEYALNTNSFQLLGTDGAGRYLVYADNKLLTVDGAALSNILSSITTTLPNASDFQTLRRGSKGDDVRALQNWMSALGYLSGSADGDFGGQSERAVSEAQKTLGLSETGEADAAFQMLMKSMVDTPLTLTKGANTASQFEAFEGKTSVDLSKVTELGLSLSYDDIAGTGRIGNNAVVSYTTPAVVEIEKRTFTLTFALGVEQGGDGVMSVYPVLDVSCVGAQRPTVQEVILKSGDERKTVEVEKLKTSLSGLNAVEKGTAVLDEGTVAMLAKAEEVGELKIRITCKYAEYDVVVDEGTIKKISTVAAAAMGL